MSDFRERAEELRRFIDEEIERGLRATGTRHRDRFEKALLAVHNEAIEAAANELDVEATIRHAGGTLESEESLVAKERMAQQYESIAKRIRTLRLER